MAHLYDEKTASDRKCNNAVLNPEKTDTHDSKSAIENMKHEKNGRSSKE